MHFARVVGGRAVRGDLHRIHRRYAPHQQELIMFVPFFMWLQETNFCSYIRESAYAYPVILSLHMVALAFFGGMIVVTDLRLLGLGMRSYSISEVLNGLRAPKRIGFIFAAICGALL